MNIRAHHNLVLAASLAMGGALLSVFVTRAQTIGDPLGIVCVDASTAGCSAHVAVSTGGPASSSFGVALAGGSGSASAPGDPGVAVAFGSGQATGQVAVSASGPTSCGILGVSATGSACGGIAVSGLGSATGSQWEIPCCQFAPQRELVTVSGAGNASGGAVAVSGAPSGSASGDVAVGAGSATGQNVAVALFGTAKACGGPAPIAIAVAGSVDNNC